MNTVISGDGAATVFNEQYGQTYHSVHGAITESELVYLTNGGVQARLEHGLETRILEIGFGLGLNFLLTARSALRTKAQLHYFAVENAPISKEIFQSLNYQAIEGLERLTEPTADLFQSLGSRPQANLTFGSQIHLQLQCADALTVPLRDRHFDSVYLDAFSPDTNPELWSVTFLRKLFFALKADGIVSSYCVKGVVQRAFIEAGFEVKKVPGPPGKREVLIASRRVLD